MSHALPLSAHRMAERCAKKKNYGLSYMYLRSAENLLTLVEEMNFECSQARQLVMKLKESVNFSLYIKDYWAISYSHPKLGMSSTMDLGRRPSMLLPNLPQTDNNSSNKNANNADINDKRNKIKTKKHDKQTLRDDLNNNIEHNSQSNTKITSSSAKIKPPNSFSENTEDEITHL